MEMTYIILQLQVFYLFFWSSLSDPYSQVIVSGETVDWLDPSMPVLMREHCLKILIIITPPCVYLIAARLAVAPQNPNQR